MTRVLLWEEYRAANPNGFGYTWFCTSFEAWKGRVRVRPSMRQTHMGGEKVFVDFAGDTIDIFDPVTGEAHAMKLFVAAMGAPNYTYAEACASESLPDWIGVHILFYGGRTAYTWKTAFAAGYARHSPGALLVNKVAESLLASGEVAAIDSCSLQDGFMAGLHLALRRLHRLVDRIREATRKPSPAPAAPTFRPSTANPSAPHAPQDGPS